MRNIFAIAFVCAVASLGACAGGNSSDDGTADGTPAPDARPVVAPVCGDSVCAPAEMGSCQADCGTPAACGNHTCDGGETTATCPTDCPASAVCGDSTCDAANGETSSTCPADCTASGGGTCPADVNDCTFCAIAGQMCPAGLDQSSCLACLAGGGGGGGSGSGGLGMCTGGIPDGMCVAPETNATCPLDCP